MESENLQVLRLHENPQYLKPCCELINDEWPRSETARMMSLQASCNHLPTSLILINDMKHLLGHLKSLVFDMADRRPGNRNAPAYRTKQTTRETVFLYQASSSNCRTTTATATRTQVVAKKKTVSRVTKPLKRKPTVKQLENKLHSQSKKMKLTKEQLNDAKQLQEKKKKKTPVQKKKQPIVDRKITIQDRYYR